MMLDCTKTELQKRADYMREWSRKRGAIAVKGVLITCARCGKQTEKQHRSHDWCAECVKPAQLERRRMRNAAKGTVSVGSALECLECKAACIKIHKRQKYCVPCMELVKSDNLPSYRAWTLQYQKERNKRVRRENPAKAISERITAQIGQAIRGKKAGRKWESIVGYGIQELMDHLERQFLKGMTWENRSSWHIDHIVPLTSFTFSGVDDPELKRAWALSNLRPLWAEDNVRKSGRRTHLL